MSHTFISATYANEANTAAVALTTEVGHVALSQSDTPQDWDDLLGSGIPIDEYIAPVIRRLVRKSLIIARLQAAGKLAAASAALNADLYTRERWYAPDRPAVYADDAEAIALLEAIGADPAVILAPDMP